MLRYRAGDLDVPPLLPDRVAAAERGLRARLRLGTQPAFYDPTLFWQWMRLPGDVVFSAGALIMGWDFLVKLRRPRGEGAGRTAKLAPAD